MKRFSPSRIFAIIAFLPTLALAAEPTKQSLTHDARLALLRHDLTPAREKFQTESVNPCHRPARRAINTQNKISLFP